MITGSSADADLFGVSEADVEVVEHKVESLAVSRAIPFKTFCILKIKDIDTPRIRRVQHSANRLAAGSPTPTPPPLPLQSIRALFR